MPNITITASAHPQHKDITLLSVKGFIDTNTVPESERTFQSVLGEKKFNLIIDLKQVNYISSAGWGIFVGEIKRIRNQKGNLFLVSMSPEVTDAYELLQFETILKSFPTVEEAVQNGFGKSQGTKVSAKSQVKKEIEKPRAETDMEKPELAISFDEPQLSTSLNKSHWFFRILMPWKWF
jgi:anti-sigma B factor antagonist